MPKKLSKDHIHTLVRWQKRGDEVNYKCAHPDCNYFAPKSFLKGKRSICAVCHSKPIILNGYHLKLSKPSCEDCSGTKESEQARNYKKIVDDILTPLEKTL